MEVTNTMNTHAIAALMVVIIPAQTIRSESGLFNYYRVADLVQMHSAFNMGL